MRGIRKKRFIRGTQINLDYQAIEADYPCIYGSTVLGNFSANKVDDGHKYSCGLQRIRGKPVVYSFGSDQNQAFELSLLQLRPDAEIHIFEVDYMHLVPVSLRHPKIVYHSYGLGYDHSQRDNVFSLYSSMKANSHKYIDILKVDVEGFEWEFIEREALLLDRVGQLLIELHTFRVRERFVINPESFIKFMTIVESFGLRVFHKEANLYDEFSMACCAEFSLIQHNWHVWNRYSKFIMSDIRSLYDNVTTYNNNVPAMFFDLANKFL